MPIGIPFIHNFLYNTYKPYRIHYFNHIYVIRGHWLSKKGKKEEKISKFEKAPGDHIFCIISNMIPITFLDFF